MTLGELSHCNGWLCTVASQPMKALMLWSQLHIPPLLSSCFMNIQTPGFCPEAATSLTYTRCPSFTSYLSILPPQRACCERSPLPPLFWLRIHKRDMKDNRSIRHSRLSLFGSDNEHCSCLVKTRPIPEAARGIVSHYT